MKNKFVKVVAVLAVVFALGVTVVGIIAPKEQVVERSIQINLPVEKVYSYMGDFKNMELWGPWISKDKNAKNIYKGTPGVVGHLHRWESTMDEVGVGEQEIVQLTPNKEIICDLRFEKPYESKAIGYYKFEKINAQTTKLVWGCEMKYGFIESILMMAMDIDTMLGNDFTKGLTKLKQVIK